jgi:hypothetical protein
MPWVCEQGSGSFSGELKQHRGLLADSSMNLCFNGFFYLLLQLSCDVTGDVNPSVTSAPLSSDELVSYSIAVADLALAYFYTENTVFLVRAVALTTAFFIDPATRMNPNLEFGQSWPGVCALPPSIHSRAIDWFLCLSQRQRLAV